MERGEKFEQFKFELQENSVSKSNKQVPRHQNNVPYSYNCFFNSTICRFWSISVRRDVCSMRIERVEVAGFRTLLILDKNERK